MLQKAKKLIHEIDSPEIISAKSGVRVTTPDKLSLIKKITPKTWVFTGLGSRGLLYHALFAEKLTKLLKKEIDL